ncbi:craniofacial development protein 2-like [Plakobranchus ocellatus]|uniref:Craniofacial development protein 2-like n=1 Tax=Plakobranchus ocellatus TaxID=259542 RepID=A0AAV4CNQ7_9GAST|nr:craniofacial development protein 2-like [Plakobranchus ocellatus]
MQKFGMKKTEDVVGPSGIGTVNERGSRLIEWCQVNDFIITNTWYQNHPRRQRTWKSPSDRRRNKIDYIFIQKRFRNAVKTSKSLPGADCDSDHIPVMFKFQIILKKLRKANANSKFQMALLKSDDKIAVAVHNKYETQKNISEVWSEMINSLNEVTEKNVPKKDKKGHKKWINKEILDLMEERHKSKHVEAKYKDLNRNIKIKCNAAKD